MRVSLCLLLVLTLIPADTYPQAIGIRSGAGSIEGSYAGSGSDLLVGLQFDYSHTLTSPYALEGGILATGSLPFATVLSEVILAPIDPNPSITIANFNSYYLGARADYELLPSWTAYLHGGLGYAKLTEYSPELQPSGDRHYQKAHSYSGLHPYIGIGTEIRPFTSLGFTVDLRYDDLPHRYQGTTLFFGLSFYF